MVACAGAHRTTHVTKDAGASGAFDRCFMAARETDWGLDSSLTPGTLPTQPASTMLSRNRRSVSPHDAARHADQTLLRWAHACV